MDYRKYLGQAGEEYACRFIEEQGLEVLERNWRDSNRGELDILAREGNTAVVVEVRTRVGIGYGSALESIDTRKVLKLRRLAAQWARQRRLHSKLRIDIVALDGASGLRTRTARRRKCRFLAVSPEDRMAQGDRVTSSLARTRAIALVGLDGNIVDVETHVGRGLVNFIPRRGFRDASLRRGIAIVFAQPSKPVSWRFSTGTLRSDFLPLGFQNPARDLISPLPPRYFWQLRRSKAQELQVKSSLVNLLWTAVCILFREFCRGNFGATIGYYPSIRSS